MCDSGMCRPITLMEMVRTKLESFVYDRRYGVFPVSFGKHQSAMNTILAWDLGDHQGSSMCRRDVQQTLGIERHYGLSGCADYYLINTVGTCFRSSVSQVVWIGKAGNLNENEKDYFTNTKIL
ncbi:MAG: hypothetical protein QM489_00400 [Candidatus Izemoplasma sp.]